MVIIQVAAVFMPHFFHSLQSGVVCRLMPSTPLGALLLQAHQGDLVAIDFFHDQHVDVPEQWQATSIEDQTVFKQTEQQLKEYFLGSRTEFSVPLKPRGTAFQCQVWQALQTVPYGEICSYKDIAIQVQRPKGYQAVGQANGKNPIPVIIPCHRVLSADGKLGGYTGGLSIKKTLLTIEGCTWK